MMNSYPLGKDSPEGESVFDFLFFLSTVLTVSSSKDLFLRFLIEITPKQIIGYFDQKFVPRGSKENFNQWFAKAVR